MVRKRIAEALLTDPTRNFLEEVKRIRSKKSTNSKTVDGGTDENSIAQVFASKYKIYILVFHMMPKSQDILSLKLTLACCRAHRFLTSVLKFAR